MLRVNAKGFIICPYCGRQTKTKVLPKTVLRDFPLYCHWCKREVVVAKDATPNHPDFPDSLEKPNS